MKSNIKFLVGAVLVAGAVTAVSVYSCEKETIAPNDQVEFKYETLDAPKTSGETDVCGKVYEKSLISTSGKKMGVAWVYNNSEKLTLYVYTYKGLYIKNAYMDVAERFEDLPLNKEGNPALDLFSFNAASQHLINLKKFEVPMEHLSKNSFIAVAADVHRQVSGSQFVSRNERAWVDGKYFGKTEKGRVFIYEKQTCTLNSADPEGPSPAPRKAEN